MIVNIDRRCTKALIALIQQDDYITIEQLSNILEQNRRRTQYDLCKINDLFESGKLPAVDSRRNKGIKLLDEHKEWFKNFYCSSQGKFNYIFTQEERCAIIICENVLGGRMRTIDEIADRLLISRNTVFLDMKLVKEKLKGYQIGFKYNQKYGYQICGYEMSKRSVFMYYISLLYPLIKDGILDYLTDSEVCKHIQKLRKIENEIGVYYSKGTLEKLAIMLAFSKNEVIIPSSIKKTNVMVNVDVQHVRSSYTYEVVSKYYTDNSDNDNVYTSIQLLSGRLSKEYYSVTEHVEVFEQLADKLVERFEQAVGIDVENREFLVYNLSNHLSHSIYRYAYGIMDVNEIEKDIKRNSEELFEIIRKVADEFSTDIGYPLNDAEVAYLTIHFSAHMRKTKSSIGKTKVLLVCDDVKKGEELRQKIDSNMPMFYVVDCVQSKEYLDCSTEYTMIISTNLLKYDGFYAYVSYNLGDVDRKNILQVYMKCRATHNEDVGMKLFKKLIQYIPKENHNKVKEIIDEYLFPQRSNLWQLLDKNNLQCVESMSNWRDAIAQAALPLLENGCIGGSYIDSMIMNVELYGMYFYFENGVYLVHAKANENVFRSGVALMTLQKGIRIRDEKTVRFLVVLASTDENEHFSVLKEVVKLCNDKKKIQKMLMSGNEAELYQVVREIAN